MEEVESGESAEERTSLLETNIVNSPYLYTWKSDTTLYLLQRRAPHATYRFEVGQHGRIIQIHIQLNPPTREESECISSQIGVPLDYFNKHLNVSKKDHIAVKTPYPIANRGHILLAQESWILVAFDFIKQHQLICTEDQVTPVTVPPKTDTTL